jgi:predicted DNA-binding antitoxin AbrB/MazE fold protein
MAEVIRAIFERGQLRPLEPVRLTEGQEVQLAILSEREHVRMALADILAPRATVAEDDLDEAALLAVIDGELQGRVSVSDAILEERRAGP